MSTRSVVARVEGDGFVGRYCHWDGYPTNRGKQLFQAYRELGSADALIKYAIREGESGYWSSFCAPSENPVEADRSTPEGEAEFQKSGSANWAHEADNTDLITSSGDDWGTEWAYVIADYGLSVFERLYGESPDWSSEEDRKRWRDTANWQLIGTYKWDEEPDWDAVERSNQPVEEEEN